MPPAWEDVATASKDPKQALVTSKTGKKGPHSVTWLYKLSGDDLRFCGDLTGTGSGAPPAEMRTKGKGKNFLVVFNRKPPKDD